MQKDSPLKLLFVINQVSGGKQKTDWEGKIKEYFKPLPHSAAFYTMTGQKDKEAIQQHIQQIQPQIVASVGGDGTVKLVAGLIKNTSVALAIIPAGSANGMAKELNIPENAEDALNIICKGMNKAIDLIQINNEICLHLSDIGLNAMLVKDFEHSNSRGMWGYAKSVFKVLWKMREMYVTIQTDTDNEKRKAFMVAIANATKYGTGAVINPDGNVSDGIFEIVVIRKMKVLELLKMLVKHKGFDASCIEVFKARNLHLSTLRNAYFQIDGEYRNKVKEIKAGILPSALRVMVPDPSAQNSANE